MAVLRITIGHPILLSFMILVALTGARRCIRRTALTTLTTSGTNCSKMKVQTGSNGSIELAVTKRERDGILAMGKQIILRMDAAEICTMLGFDKQEVVEFLTRFDSLVPLPANITGIDYSLALSRDHICLLLAILRESYQELGQREFVASTGIPLDLWRSWINYMVEVTRETESG